MNKTIVIATAMLLGTSTLAAAAQKGASGYSPGHEMQSSPSGSSKGASEFSPGDRMQDKGTTGMSTKGASEFSPGDRMNDRAKSN
jgi:Spy/CpxP family protein refolding chaperone